MFVRSEPIEKASIDTSLNLVHFLLLALLSLLTAFVCLAQWSPFVKNYETFIRSLELLFAGVFLLHTARSDEAPALTPSTASWLFLGWLGAASVSVVLSHHAVLSLVKHAEWLTHLLFGFTLWHFLRRDATALKGILLLIPLGFFLTGLFLLTFWFSLNDPRAHNWFVGTPLFGHIRHFGYYALAGLIFSASPLLASGKGSPWPRRILALAALSICWGFLFWTGGRAAIGAGCVGLALIVWFAGRGRRAWTAAICLAATGIGLWLSTLFWVENPWVGLLHLVERTSEATSVNGVASGRLTIWAGALEPIEGVRWLVGLGPDAYRHLPTKTFGVQPHSMLVQFVLDWGVLGAMPFIALLGVLVGKALSNLRRERDPLRRAARVTALALIVGSTVHSLVDGLYYHAQPLLFLCICFAIVLLPTAPLPAQAVRHPIFGRLASRRVLWGIVLLLALIFVLDSSALYALLYRN